MLLTVTSFYYLCVEKPELFEYSNWGFFSVGIKKGKVLRV